MKSKIIFICLVILVFIGMSCNKDSEIGQMRDIGLEKTEIKVTSEGSSFSVKTKETGWGISRLLLFVDGKETAIHNTFYIKDIKGDKVNTYYETMSGEWYEVTKSTEDEVTVKISANETGKERKLVITITGIGLVGNLTIVQEKDSK